MPAAVRCTCPSCRSVYRVPDSLIGKEMTCPKCKKRVVARTIGGSMVLELAGVDGRAPTMLHTPKPEPMTTEYVPEEVLEVEAAPKAGRWWLWGALAGAVVLAVFCAGGVAIIGMIGNAAHEAIAGTEVRGNYPPPQSTYQGWGAEHYFAMMLDTERVTYMEGVSGLQNLGKEGIPFLLRGILRFQQTGQDDHLKACLLFCNPALVDDEDLPIFVKIVKGKPRDVSALRFFVRSDGAGKKYLGALRDLQNDLDVQFAWSVRDTLHKINPEHEPAAGESPQQIAEREAAARQTAEKEARNQEAIRRDQERQAELRRSEEERKAKQKQLNDEARSIREKKREGMRNPFPRLPPR